jgi:hypothetical protein
MPDDDILETTEDLYSDDIRPRALFAGEELYGQPFILMTADVLALLGSLDNGLVTDATYGTSVCGPIL